MVSNMDIAGYTPVAKAAIQSWCDLPYCDEVIVVDGHSIDSTVEILENTPDTEKLSVKKASHPWPANSWSWEDIHSIEKDCIDEVKKIEWQQKLYMWLPIDCILYEHAGHELHSAFTSLIDSDVDFINWMQRKVITRNYVSGVYLCPPEWCIQSITKFQPGIEWGDVHWGERGIDTSRPPKWGFFHPKAPPLCYDMFMFTKKNIEDKIKRHIGVIQPDSSWPKKENTSLDEYIAKQYVNKLQGQLKLIGMPPEMHPIRAREGFLNDLTEEHFGYDLFGHAKDLKIS